LATGFFAAGFFLLAMMNSLSTGSPRVAPRGYEVKGANSTTDGNRDTYGCPFNGNVAGQ
jgi:hypothetical protein